MFIISRLLNSPMSCQWHNVSPTKSRQRSNVKSHCIDIIWYIILFIVRADLGDLLKSSRLRLHDGDNGELRVLKNRKYSLKNEIANLRERRESYNTIDCKNKTIDRRNRRTAFTADVATVMVVAHWAAVVVLIKQPSSVTPFVVKLMWYIIYKL